MSRRTFEANKAILAAWQNEQDLVRNGKGTRDWSQEQQQDILDRGKAYDDDGRAFEGQHMKSVEKYPASQGDPKNIQFLTKAEHLEAHQGNWQNPTNWYYDPETKQFFDFGEGGLIPCKIIELSHPVVNIVDITEDTHTVDDQDKQVDKETPLIADTEKGSLPPSSPSTVSVDMPHKIVSAPKVKSENALKRFANGAGKIARKVGKFALDHKEEIIGVAVTVGAAIWAAVTSSDSNSSGNSDYVSGGVAKYSPPTDVDNAYFDTSGSTERSSPREHEVPGHSQRYHTKNGVEIREKAPYHRGGKKEE